MRVYRPYVHAQTELMGLSRSRKADLSGHVSSATKGCSRQAMQRCWNGSDDAVMYELASNDSRLLKVVGAVQGGALGLVLCKPLPVA